MKSKLFALIALVLVLVTATVFASASTKYTLSSTAQVYQKASTSSTHIGKLPAGSHVYVESISGGWAKLNIDGYRGYIKASCLNKGSKASKGTYTVTTSTKVYGNASASGHSIGKLGKGASVKVLKVCGSYGRIKYGGTYGYVKMSNLKK